MLEIEDLALEVEGRGLLWDVNMAIQRGETHVLFGPTGSGKTSLLMAVMGFPRYRITRGVIRCEGQDITHLSLDERARLGMGLSFQRPPAVRSLTLRSMVMACVHDSRDGYPVEDLARKVRMEELLDRQLNRGFSGGELKRSELLQLLVQQPRFVMFDEPESGVDLDSISLVGEVMNELLEKDRMRTRGSAGLIITHTGHILDYVHAVTGYVLLDGTIVCGGNPNEILDNVRKNGYEGCRACTK